MQQHLTQLAKHPDWQAIMQPPATLTIESSTHCLRLDYDFQGSGGFVVARLPLTLELEQRFAFDCALSGSGQTNQLEFKLADAHGNCWRYLDMAFTPGQTPAPLRLTQDSFAFAWGPAGFGAPKGINAIEIALLAVEGGQGSLLVQNLEFCNLGPELQPMLSVSSQRPGWRPEDWWTGQAPWRPAGEDAKPWLLLDFQAPRRLAGLRIHWLGEGTDTSLEALDDQGHWQPLAQGLCPAGDQSYFWLAEAELQCLRIQLAHPAAIQAIDWLKASAIQTPGVTASPQQALAQYFHWQAMAAPAGWYPRHLLRQQSYWTCLGTPEGQGSALINEEGQLELDGADACLDALLFVDGRLHGWAEAEREQRLHPDGLPMPEVQLSYAALGLRLDVRALALHQCLVIEYRLHNLGPDPRAGQLLLALRPFQLTPVWQAGHRHFGGMGRLFELQWSEGKLLINGQRRLRPLTAPARAGVSSSQRNEVIADLAQGQVPPEHQCQDPLGWASAALAYDFSLASGDCLHQGCLIPYANQPIPDLAALNELGHQGRTLAAQLAWQAKVAKMPRLQIPAELKTAQTAALAARTAIGHSLVQRMGRALQPGARRYTRAWIRDGVIQAAALLRAGCIQEAAQYLEWYSGHQTADGRIPCCIDTSDPKGPDWLVEHDSLGQFIFGIMEVWRLSGDSTWLARLWPSVELALSALETLLRQPASNPLGAGLLPPSASHEGYLAHPVQANWDNFWALRGIRDALDMARQLGKPKALASIGQLLQRFEQDLGNSLQAIIEAGQLDYVPASVELADFDPAATATAIAWLDRLPGISTTLLNTSFDRYLQGFRQRRDGQTPWQQYSAYEIRIIPALVRLERRDEAHELLAYFLDDRRPMAWNQWPEISWRDLRAPGHLGDLPHAWIGAEFFLAWQGLFAYEHPSDQRLVIAAGIPNAWLETGEILAVSGLRTYWGQLDIRLQRLKTGLHLQLAGDYRPPAGGILLQPPLRPDEPLLVNGRLHSPSVPWYPEPTQADEYK